MGKYRRDNLIGIVQDLFEGFGPLKWLLSQGMWAFSPFLAGSARSTWDTIARDLENVPTQKSNHEEENIKP